MTRTRPNFAPTALAIAVSLSAAHLHAADLPAGGNIVGGSGSISQDGNSLNVQQNSDKLITNWDSFDIGAGNTVNFYQPGSNSVALNRVIGEDASAIYGNLNANGKVFLVNPNGVLFGQGAAVNVGALVASTLSLSDEDFNDGNYQFSGDGNNAAVINRGRITADGGAVALLGGQVSNHGIIQANQGTVALAAGDQITLDFAGDGLLNVTVDEGTLNALVENHQLVRANGGQVVMTADATNALLQTVVNNTGIIEAQTLENQSGTIVLKGGFNGGTVNVAGTLDASAPDSGDGGFIDTSGAHVKIADGTRVTTKANNGTTGEWLIDPTDFTINAGSDALTDSGIGAATLSANLENNNVTLATVDGGTEAGDMYVNGAVSWNADHTLSLNAHNNIHINEAITATNGGLTLNAGGNISADGAVNVGTFNLQRGAWSQLGSNLADFTAKDFRLNTANARFLRATGGDGSEGNAYQIVDLYGLQGIASRSLLSSHFALSNDIDASGTTNWNGGAGFVPIGNGTNNYTGSFDGQGHVINGLAINNTATTTQHWGLFGVNSGTIRDIGLAGGGVTVRGNNSYYYAGALAGYNYGTISNAYATGNVSARSTGSASAYAGGLVGYNSGSINNAYATGEVTTNANRYSKLFLGGLVGANGTTGTITNAHATGHTKTNASGDNIQTYIGGLVGSNAGAITNAHAAGAVISTNAGNYNRRFAGGLVGSNSGVITNAYATGATTSTTGGIYATHWVGGLVGHNSGTLTNVYATGDTEGEAGTDGTSYAGGLAGYNSGAIINAYATGNVTASGENKYREAVAGGLVGKNAGILQNTYATGNVAAGGGREVPTYVGGLVGINENAGTISNTYATGVVTASSDGPEYVGGLIGYNHASGTLTDSYWVTHTSGTTTGVGNEPSPSGVTGLTTAQMFDAANFSGFDFAGTWANADNQTTPYLRDLAGNRVFNKNDLPTGTIDATNRPALYTVIQNAEQLQAMRDNLAANYLLGNHIDASATVNWNDGAGFDPLGVSNNSFSGQLDGMGYIVDGLTIQRADQLGVGLFGYTTADSQIRNLGLSNVNIQGQSFVGALVGKSLGLLDGVFATGRVRGDFVVGGLAGSSQGKITESYAATDIEAFSIAGGLIGSQGPGIYDSASQTRGTSSVDYSYATGTIKVTVDPASGSAGGLVGMLDGAIRNSYSTVIINDTLAGLIGSWTQGVLADVYYANTDPDGTSLDAVGFNYGGRSWAEMTQLDTFSTWGNDIDAEGGTGSIWRIYEGHTGPLLRRFLTVLEVTGEDTVTTYDGTEQSGSWSATGEYDAERIYGQPARGKNAGSYTLDMDNLYSDQQGYDLITNGGGTLTINKAQATVTANSGTTTYNGTEQSVSGFTVDGLVNGEEQSVLTGVTTSGGKGTNAGSYTLTASGADGNYELTFVDGTLTIERKAITGSITADGKTYDGSTYANTHGTLDGVISGDDLQFNTTGAFADKHVGTGKQVTVSGSLGGGDASNYVLTTNSSTTANIDRKTITADVRALDKLFDGSLAATLEGVLNGTISGDDVALQLSGVFASLKPGENRVLVDASLTGADAGNYQLVAPDSVTANMRGFVQSADYQSAIDSQPQEQRGLSAPNDTGYQLDVDDDALHLPMASR
ncbi:GLUG motif-containing protein [Halopseudomonas oceani]|uniref:beta strand repeat-containing protein n=1 Tax=Halopseudomonas oceani TaxID=1708783 RepID=UPI002AA72ADF|nr:GLUG motif-containing protein [Halopseudomonas oceani]